MFPRRFIQWFPLLLALPVLLSACQTPQPSPTVQAPTLQPTLAATTIPSTPSPSIVPPPESLLGVSAEALRGIRVHLWFSGSPAMLDQINNQVRLFNGSNTYGVWIEPTAFGSFMELSSRVQAVLGTPNQPDLVEDYPELATAWEKEKPVRVDLNPYIHDPVWGVEPSMAADIPSGIWQPVPADTKQLGIPAYRSALALAYNQTWAQALGFSHPPVTTTEFQEQSCAAAKALLKTDSKLDDGLGGWIVDTRALTAASWLRAFSVNPWAAADGSYTYQLPGSSTAFGFLKDMLDQGCIWVARNPQPYGYFANRQALFYTLSSDDLPLQERASAAAKDTWVVIPFPSSDGQPVVLTEGPDWTLLEGQPETQLAGWLFVRWMLDPARQADLVTATGSLPVRAAAGALLSEYMAHHPQWAEFWKLAEVGEPVPTQPNWTVAAPVLQDAFSQIFSGATTREQLPDILIQLDQTLYELLSRTP